MFIFKFGIKSKLFLQLAGSCLIGRLLRFLLSYPPNFLTAPSPIHKPLASLGCLLSHEHSKVIIGSTSLFNVFSAWNIFSKILLWLAFPNHSDLSLYVISSERPFLVTLAKINFCNAAENTSFLFFTQFYFYSLLVAF